MAERELATLLKGYSLTTAEILYRLPDHPALLQSYIWQDYDMSPRFPKLLGFLDFWTRCKIALRYLRKGVDLGLQFGCRRPGG